ncbi:MAG: hypothetical protein HKN47_17090, partial [Pirellulaceae bacterium]|nr:hypothetical protein [Pirellulaceae bacterium]
MTATKHTEPPLDKITRLLGIHERGVADNAFLHGRSWGDYPGPFGYRKHSASENPTMSWFRRNVLVTFINDATDEIFAESEMPPAKLPESFVAETTLHIGDADWSVVHAEPQSK